MVEVIRKFEYGSILYYIKVTEIRHREDGPAIELLDGTKGWYSNGIKHRVDGPAIEYCGELTWALNDVCFRTKEFWFESLTEEQKEKMLYSEYFIGG
jgi:hypothetical protein